MQEIVQINKHIHRTTIPYKDIFTTIYTIRTDEGVMLFDAASYDTDAQAYVLPFLQKVGVSAEELKYIFISHNHADHAGGLHCLAPHFPKARILSRSPDLMTRFAPTCHFAAPEEGDVYMGVLEVVTIPGHTLDSMAVLDRRTNTMITGDCLQVYGIVGSQDWASNIRFPAEYLEALEKVRGLNPDQIVTAHDYYPCGYRAEGQAEARKMIDMSEAPMRRLQKLIVEHPELGDDEIRALYNNDPQAPTLRLTVVSAMRAAVEAGRIK